MTLRRLASLLAFAALPLMAATCTKDETEPDPEEGLAWRGTKFTMMGKDYDFRQTRYYEVVKQDADGSLSIHPDLRTKSDSVLLNVRIGRTAFPDTIDLEKEKFGSDITVAIYDTSRGGTLAARYWSLNAAQNSQGKIILTKVSGKRMLGTFTGTLKRQQGDAAKYPAEIQITNGVIDTWQQITYP